MPSCPLDFAIGASPGPVLGARDPEGHDALETLARDGINLIRLPAIESKELEGLVPGRDSLPPSVQRVADQLEWAERAGRGAGTPMYVAINVGELSVLDESPSRRRWLDYIIKRFGEHPAAGVWKVLDEPNNPYTPDDKERRIRIGMRRAYARIKQLDPHHPIWVTQAPQPARRVTTRYFRAYGDTADIFAVDLYPISDPLGKHSGIRNHGPSAVGDFAARLATVAREATARGTPKWVWMVLQGAGWSGVVPRDERRRAVGPVLMQPHAAMLRYMTYQAIIGGAEGVLYFGMNVGLYPETQPFGWDWGYWRGAVGPVVHQLRSAPLAPALVANQRLDVSAVAPRGRARVDACALQAPDGSVLVLAARRERLAGEPREAEIRLDLPAGAIEVGSRSAAEVCFEGREVTLDGHALHDRFLPCEVHVYRLSPP
jgi:hypothetical protein